MNLISASTIRIQCPVETVFEYAVNMENFGRWFPRVKGIRSANELAHGEVGKRYYETVSLPVVGNVQIPLTVVDCRPRELFVTEGRLPVLNPRMEIAFRKLDAKSCEVSWRMLSRSRFGLGRLAANPMVRNVMQKRAEVGLSRLKKGMENGFAVAPTPA